MRRPFISRQRLVSAISASFKEQIPIDEISFLFLRNRLDHSWVQTHRRAGTLTPSPSPCMFLSLRSALLVVASLRSRISLFFLINRDFLLPFDYFWLLQEKSKVMDSSRSRSAPSFRILGMVADAFCSRISTNFLFRINRYELKFELVDVCCAYLEKRTSIIFLVMNFSLSLRPHRKYHLVFA